MFRGHDHWVNNVLRSTEFWILYKIFDKQLASLLSIIILFHWLSWSSYVNYFRGCSAICTNDNQRKISKVRRFVKNTINQASNFNRVYSKVWFIVCIPICNIFLWVIIYKIIILSRSCRCHCHEICDVCLIAISIILCKVTKC